MSRFTTAIDIADYALTVEVTYGWRPIIPASFTGPEEGGVELEDWRIVAAFDDDGQVVDDPGELAKLTELLGQRQQELADEAERNCAAACEAAEEAWAEARSER